MDVNSDGVITRDEFLAQSTNGGLFDSTTPHQIHLSLTNDPTQMVVMWVTDGTADHHHYLCRWCHSCPAFSRVAENVSSVVRFGESSNNYSTTVSGESWTYDVGILGGMQHFLFCASSIAVDLIGSRVVRLAQVDSLCAPHGATTW